MTDAVTHTVEPENIYKAVIIGGDDVNLTPVQADKIRMAMVLGDKAKVYHIKQSDVTLRVGDVRRVERDYIAEKAQRLAEIERVAQQQSLLKIEHQRTTCHATRSIQLEINNIAQGEGGQWGNLIRNKNWRERTRQQLLAQDDGLWCDYKVGTCACPDVVVAVA